MTTFPEWATYVGYPGQNANWTDNSRAAIELRHSEIKSTLKAIQSIRRKNLNSEDALSYDLFLKEAMDSIEGLIFPDELLPIQQMSGIQVDIPELLMSAPKNSKQDYLDMLSRLNSSPIAIEQVQKLMEEGLRKNIVQPKIIMLPIGQQIDDLLKEKIEESPLYLPFAEIKGNNSMQDKAFIQKAAKEAIQAKTYPALKKFKEFFTSKYLPGCRDTIGFFNLENGKNWYDFKIRHHTTEALNATEIHQIGLQEVARILQQMEKIKTQVGFNGDLKKFNDFLKTEARFYYTDAHELVAAYRNIAKQIDPKLPELFGRLPRLPYGIREIPAYKAPSAPTAYYQGGSLESGRAGYFETNTFNLKARPKWQMEALTLHEAVPGHHLQIALAQELTNLPEFRKNMGPTAFVEGWGLYAESLGLELGMYQYPYSKYGQLNMKDNSPISEQQIINETDRYIADPGQALAYKIGELKFKDLRKKSQVQLGDKFSLRDFHDQLLNAGALPLDIIEKKILTWLQTKSTVAK